jgi:hypothetical protein
MLCRWTRLPNPERLAAAFPASWAILKCSTRISLRQIVEENRRLRSQPRLPRVCLTVATPSDNTVCKLKSWLSHMTKEQIAAMLQEVVEETRRHGRRTQVQVQEESRTVGPHPVAYVQVCPFSFPAKYPDNFIEIQRFTRGFVCLVCPLNRVLSRIMGLSLAHCSNIKALKTQYRASWGTGLYMVWPSTSARPTGAMEREW